MGNILSEFRETSINILQRQNHARVQTIELKNKTEIMRWIKLQNEYNKVSGNIVNL